MLLLCFLELVKFGSFACISKVLRDFPGGPVQGTRVHPLVREDPTCHGGQQSLCDATTEPLL